MSILIRDMGLPTYGATNVLVLQNGEVYGMKYGSDKWELLGQATELPPHGDLVDRAEMREIAISLLDKAVTDQEANAIREMWSCLGQMPVYIPAEEGE